MKQAYMYQGLDSVSFAWTEQHGVVQHRGEVTG